MSAEKLNLPAAVWIAPAILCVLALGPWPYGYYMFLRLIVCVSALAIAYSSWTLSRSWALGFVAIALCFNPILPVYLDRGAWAITDLAVGAIYVAHWMLVVRLHRLR